MKEEREEGSGNRQVTGDELAGFILLILVVVIPTFLVGLLPENKYVSFFLGGGRIFLIWAVFFSLVWLFRESIDRWAARFFSSREKPKSTRESDGSQ